MRLTLRAGAAAAVLAIATFTPVPSNAHVFEPSGMDLLRTPTPPTMVYLDVETGEFVSTLKVGAGGM